MDSIRPLQNYEGGIVPQAVLNGTLGTVVYASNYNDLDNKPSINSVELRGNKTAEDLGLATPADITVTSVNTQTGDVSLTGQNIPYDSTYSVTEKINDLESQIVDSGVSSINGHTGAVILTGSDINYSVGVSLNAKIDAVEQEIPIVNYPVTSVNGETGAVVLDGSDIAYDVNNTVNEKIASVESEIPTVDYPVTSVNNKTGDVELTGADIPLGSDFTDPTSTAGAIKALKNKQLVSLGSTSAVTIADTRIDIGSSATVNLDVGNYIVEIALPVTINNASAFFYFNVDIDGTSTNLTTITGPQGIVTLYGIAKVAVSTNGNHTIKITGRCSTASKTVTVPTSYNLNMLITLTE